MSFAGAKLALFIGQDLLVILRDERPDIPYPGHWDLPGGGREGAETPEACALREAREETGLIVPPRALMGATAVERPHGRVWFFAAHLPKQVQNDIRFGGEGQEWRLMAPADYCAHPRAIRHFAEYVAGCLGQADRKNRVLHRKAPRGQGGGR